MDPPQTYQCPIPQCPMAGLPWNGQSAEQLKAIHDRAWYPGTD